MVTLFFGVGVVNREINGSKPVWKFEWTRKCRYWLTDPNADQTKIQIQIKEKVTKCDMRFKRGKLSIYSNKKSDGESVT